MKILLSLIICILTISCIQESKMQPSPKAIELLTKLNSWHKDELIEYEEDLDPNLITGGETNGYISCHKDLLKGIGYQTVWNSSTKQYDLKTDTRRLKTLQVSYLQ